MSRPLAVLAVTVAFAGAFTLAPGHRAPQQVAAARGLPVLFVPNRGQLPADVRFAAQTARYTFSLSDTGARVASDGRELRMRLVGARPVRPEPGVRRPGVVNYFRGRDRSRWIRQVPTFANVRARGVYRGIDVTYRASRGDVEYVFTVAEGADPSVIAIEADGVSIDRDGRLEIGPLRVQAPRAFQVRGDERRPVRVAYRKRSDGTIGFAVGDYDRSLPLTIDPVLQWATFAGGSGFESAMDVASAPDGSVFLTAWGGTSTPSGDVIVSKFDAGGRNLLYETHLGGGDFEAPQALAVGGDGAAYVTGGTYSADWPTTGGAAQPQPAGDQDVFVTKLSGESGTIAWSTYLGGGGSDLAHAIALGPADAVYLTGGTPGEGFPVTADALRKDPVKSEIFVTRLAADGKAFTYSTLYGGSNTTDRPSGGEVGRAIAVDAEGAAYIAGWTDSRDLPVVNTGASTGRPMQPVYGGGFSDAFAAKIVPGQTAAEWSGYLGGTGKEAALAVAVGPDGSAYLAGHTDWPDFPTFMAEEPVGGGTSGVDGWAARVSPEGSSLQWSTFLHGTDAVSALALDPAGQLHVGGYTSNSDLPATDDAAQPELGGGMDGFFETLLPGDGTRAYATYLGGSENDEVAGIGLRADGSVAISGSTDSADFPTSEGAAQMSYGGGGDMFAAVVGPQVTPTPTATATATATAGSTATATATAEVSATEPAGKAQAPVAPTRVDRPRISLVRPGRARRGRRVSLAGIVTAYDTGCMVRVPVTLMRTSGAILARTRTGLAGEFAVQIRPRQRMRIAATVPARPGCSAARSRARLLRVR